MTADCPICSLHGNGLSFVWWWYRPRIDGWKAQNMCVAAGKRGRSRNRSEQDDWCVANQCVPKNQSATYGWVVDVHHQRSPSHETFRFVAQYRKPNMQSRIGDETSKARPNVSDRQVQIPASPSAASWHRASMRLPCFSAVEDQIQSVPIAFLHWGLCLDEASGDEASGSGPLTEA